MPSPHYRFRILYVGRDCALPEALQGSLADLDCIVVRCPANGVAGARRFIRSDIRYSAFLFDEVLSGATGEELARFARALDHRATTPAFIVKECDDGASLSDEVGRVLGAGIRAGRRAI